MHVYPWVTCFHANYIMDSFVFGIYMYIVSFDKSYIYLEVCFYDFHFCLIKGYSCLFWALLTIFYDYTNHITFVHSHHFCLLMILFHEQIFELYRLRVSSLVFLTYFMRYIWFGFLFEGSLTSFSKVTLTSYLFFIW